MSTNIKCDSGNTEDGLCNWIQLEGVNRLLVPLGRTDLCEYDSEFNDRVHSPLC